MSMLIPPQMVNTMDVSDLWQDPVRRYMAPALGGSPDRLAQSPPRPPATACTRPTCGWWRD